MMDRMPFAGYDDFDDCVAKNQDKADPEAYCGKIKSETEMGVTDLEEVRRARVFQMAQSRSRHPAGRKFRKPQP